MSHQLVIDLLYKDVTIEYDDCWEESIIDAHMNIALSSYETGDDGAGYGSADLLSRLALNEEAKTHFRNIAYFYLAGFAGEWGRMFK